MDALALLMPQARQTGCCGEFPGFGLLIAGSSKGLMEAGFGVDVWDSVPAQ